MTRTQGDLAALSRFVFRAPSWYTTSLFALCIAAAAGAAAFESRYVLEDAWQGIFYIGIPTVTAGLLTTPVDRWLGGQLTFNRSSLLALFCEVVAVLVLVLAGTIAVLTTYGESFVFDALIAALGLIFAIRLLVVLAVSRNSWLAIVPAAIQPGVAAILLFIYSGTMRFLELGGPADTAYLSPFAETYLSRSDAAPPELLYVTPDDFVLLGGVAVLYAAVTFATVRVIDRPWQRALGVSVLDFVRGFVGHIAEGSRELEDFFEEIGEEAVVPVTVLAFRTPDGEEKARFVLPMIHPGPMGEIGGGNLPRRVAETAEGLAFPPHATAGHDFNLVTRQEVETLLAAADSAYREIEYTDAATPGVRASDGDASVLAQAVGDDALVVATYSPECADDVAYGVGLSAAAEARSAGLDDVMVVDAHNCNDGLAGEDLGHVNPGGRRSFEFLEATRIATAELVDAPRGPLRLGVAWDPTEWEPADGIGPLGVRVAVFDVDGHTTAYVLVDGNNMEPGLRERVVATVDAVDEIEVMTTDTHVVNTVESVNQVGEAIDVGAFVDLVETLVAEALADREPVEGGMASERAAVTVFGNDRTETLASHANAVVTMGGAFLIAVVASTLAISALVFLFA